MPIRDWVGVSTGQPIVARIALKPTASIPTPLRTVDTAGEETEIRTTGRHDPCVGIRATPIAEALLALVLITAWAGRVYRRAVLRTGTRLRWGQVLTGRS